MLTPRFRRREFRSQSRPEETTNNPPKGTPQHASPNAHPIPESWDEFWWDSDGPLPASTNKPRAQVADEDLDFDSYYDSDEPYFYD